MIREIKPLKEKQKEVVELFRENGVWQRTTFINGIKATDEIIVPKKLLNNELR